jgi:ribosomal protein S21
MRRCNAEVKLRKFETVDRLIRRFSRKVKNSRILEEVEERRFFEKPSMVNKRKRIRRKKVYAKLHQEHVKSLMFGEK